MADIDKTASMILALQELTATTGTITNRVQSRILRSLSDSDLLAVALVVKKRREISDILSGKKQPSSVASAEAVGDAEPASL